MRSVLSQLKVQIRCYLHKGRGRYCPICDKSFRKFGDCGNPKRKEAFCYYCGSLERHRLVWLYLKRMTDFFNERSKSILHVAPEPCFEKIFKKHLGQGYISADIQNPRARVLLLHEDFEYQQKYSLALDAF